MSIPFRNIPDAEYHAIELPSASATKRLIGRTNAHLAWEIEHPPEPSEALVLGSLVHTLLLQPDRIDADWIVADKIDRRTTAGKAEWEALKRRSGLTGARVVSREAMEQARAVAESVQSHDAAARILKGLAHREASLIGTIAGRPAKSKFDGLIIDDDGICAVDLKTTVSASPRDFGRACAQFHYAHQAAFYRRILKSCGGIMDSFVLIAVEKTPPYLTATYVLAEDAIEAADRNIDALVGRWWQVHEGNRDGYSSGILNLNVPKWTTEGDRP